MANRGDSARQIPAYTSSGPHALVPVPRRRVSFWRDVYHGAVLGDFAREKRLGGALTQVVLSFTPGVGTICAGRDCIADLRYRSMSSSASGTRAMSCARASAISHNRSICPPTPFPRSRSGSSRRSRPCRHPRGRSRSLPASRAADPALDGLTFAPPFCIMALVEILLVG